MDDYIRRQAAIDACFNGWNNAADDCARNIKRLPAADVAPVVHARWEKKKRYRPVLLFGVWVAEHA